MADFTVSTTIDNFMQAATLSAAQLALSIGTTLSSNENAPFLMINNYGSFPGDVRGNNAVDLQIQRTNNTKIAKGTRSSLLGGLDNTAVGVNSVVVGGTNNSALCSYSAIVGGSGNIAQGASSEVLGGDSSIAMGTGSSTIGGVELSAIGNYSAVVGGGKVKIDSNAKRSGSLGGFQNTVSHDKSVILGGENIITDASETAFVNNMDVKSSIYIKQITAAGADKAGKCQLWVNATGDLYLTLPNGTDKQIAFV